MASFDYDVIVIGSGFGGTVTALRATEKGSPATYQLKVRGSDDVWRSP